MSLVKLVKTNQLNPLLVLHFFALKSYWTIDFKNSGGSKNLDFAHTHTKPSLWEGKRQVSMTFSKKISFKVIFWLQKKVEFWAKNRTCRTSSLITLDVVLRIKQDVCQKKPRYQGFPTKKINPKLIHWLSHNRHFKSRKCQCF